MQAHPWLSDEEREKLAGVIDCQKLTLEACTHAAQNERLPLRAVVQVLFFEQLQLREAITGSLLTAADISGPVATSGDMTAQQETTGGQETWQTAVRENQVLRLDMDSMRSRVRVLERDCSTMRKAIAKIDRTATTTTTRTTTTTASGNGKRWGGFGRRFGCKFKTQVCDSHEKGSTIEAKKGRAGQHLREHREVGSYL